MSPTARETPPFVIEQASFSSRQTELSWTFGFAYDAVWDAVNSAAGNLGMTLLSMDRGAGLTVAKPPFSLLNVGRRIAVTFQKTDAKRTRVRAVYLHGLMCLSSRHSRQQTLDTLFRSALADLAPPVRQTPTPAPAAPTVKPVSKPKPAPGAPQPAAAGVPRSAPRPQTPPSPGAAPAANRPSAPAGPGPALDLREMDFRHIDPESLPLTPPSGAEARRYLRPALQRPPGAGRRIGWFALGMGIAILAFILSGGLSLVLRR